MRVVFLSLVVLPLVGCGSAGSLRVTAVSGTSGGKLIRVRGTIETVAMDGPRVAYDRSVPAAGCNKAFVANLLTGKSQVVSRCFSDLSTSRYLAIAGRRIAWIDEACDPSGCDQTLAAASLPRGKPRELATTSCNNGNADTGEPCGGTSIESLVGSGNLLAVNRGATNRKGVDTSSSLDVIGANGLRQVASGGKARWAEAADSGHVAVLRENGTVGIYSAQGRLLGVVKPRSVASEFFSGYGDSLALDENDLLVITKKRTLDVYDWHSGARLYSWPVRRGATNLSASAGLAAYAEAHALGGPYKLHVVRLATGKDVTLGTGTWFTGERDVVLGSDGLVYLKNRRTLLNIPLDRALAAVS